MCTFSNLIYCMSVHTHYSCPGFSGAVPAFTPGHQRGSAVRGRSPGRGSYANYHGAPGNCCLGYKIKRHNQGLCGVNSGSSLKWFENNDPQKVKLLYCEKSPTLRTMNEVDSMCVWIVIQSNSEHLFFHIPARRKTKYCQLYKYVEATFRKAGLVM